MLKYLIAVCAAIYWSVPTLAQPDVEFFYDNAGNRMQRMVFVMMIVSNPPITENTDGTLVESELNEEENPENFSEPFGENQVTIYPNPTNGKVFIKLDPSMEPGELTVMDGSGKVLEQRKLVSYQSEVDLMSKPNGDYIFVIRNQDGMSQWKVIKQ